MKTKTNFEWRHEWGKRVVALLVVVLSGVYPSVGCAQDGLLLSASPPVTVRFNYDGQDVYAYFTNTGDKIIHAVTVTSKKNGDERSKVVIDTIEPHKTVSLRGMELANAGLISGDTVSITCKDYSKPLKIVVFE